MRITYITAGAGMMYCGTCLRDGALAAALSHLGHDVTLVPTYTPLRLEGENIAVHQLFLGGINVYLQEKLALFRHTPRFVDRLLDSGSLLRWASGFGHMTAAAELAKLTISMLDGDKGHQLKEVNRLVKWMAEEPKPDLILLPNTMLAGVGRAISHRLNVPALSFVSGEDQFIEEFPEPWRTRTRSILQRETRSCAALIAHNASYARYMADYLNVPLEMFRIAPLGVECSDYADMPPRHRGIETPWTIGFLARICPQKGLHNLADAFRILREKAPIQNCVLKVAGYLGPEYRSYLDGIRRDIEGWGLADSFEYVGELERPAKVQFLQSLDVFCVPSLHCEAKAQFAPEALAAGVPIVVPRIGGLMEWVEETGGGVVVDADSPDALAAGFLGIISTYPESKEMGQKGREAIQRNHTVAKMAEAVTRIAEEVIAENRPMGKTV